jgi:hypothetical protein
MMKTLSHSLRILALWPVGMAALCLSTGCTTLTMNGKRVPTAEYVPVNHAGDAILPAGLHRVVLLPISGGTIATAESTAMLDLVAVAALQEQDRFEVVPITREECSLHFHQDDVSSVSALPSNFMATLRREYNADAVIFVDVTVYNAYEPIEIGLRAKLATTDDARLVWMFDNVFSTGNPSVASSATRYLQHREQGGLPSELDQVALESPTRFATYVTAAMFATLPPLKGAGVPSEGHKRTSRDAAMKR